MQLEDLVTRLGADGMLLLTDAKFPSVVALAAGGPVKGSWWSHPRGKAIYALLQDFCAHEDVLTLKLIDGKVTFVHRRLWPALLSIAREREAWQMEKLSKPARDLLARVDKANEFEAHGAAVKELELRLLVHSAQVHTKSGAHALIVTSWNRWARLHGPLGRNVPIARAKKELRANLEQLNELHRAKAKLPFE